MIPPLASTVDDLARRLADTASAARVLVVGSLNLDTILFAERAPGDEGAVLVTHRSVQHGGHAGNCASALAALGLRPDLVACVGADDAGTALLDDLRQRGVGVSHVVQHAGAPTGQAIIPVLGDEHFMLIDRGANDLLPGEVVGSGTIAGYDAVLVFDPSVPSLRATTVAARAATPRPWLCWNPGGILARDPVAREIVGSFDSVFLNADEYRGIQDPAAPQRLHLGGAEAVVTSGADGSAWFHDGRRQSCPTTPVVATDPVGAGDSFAAAFVLARLAGLPVQRCLQLGNRAGAVAVTAPGARGRLATVADIAGEPVRTDRREEAS